MNTPAAPIAAYASAVLMLLFLSAAVALLGWPWWGFAVITAAAMLIAAVECAVRRTNVGRN
jgi:hypothetical protein